MRTKILEVMQEIRPDIDFENETKLIDDKILESFDMIVILEDLCEKFDIEISPNDLTAHNFNSVDSIEKMIERIVNGK